MFGPIVDRRAKGEGYDDSPLLVSYGRSEIETFGRLAATFIDQINLGMVR